MKGKDEQLLLADICARLPYGVKFASFSESMKNHSEPTTLRQIYYNRDYNASNIEGDDNDNISTIIALMKPYLRLMSSMTKKEERAYKKLKDKVVIKWDELSLPTSYTYVETAKSIDWLNANHFDYRDLIKKGLALEAPEGMYTTA